MHIFIAESRYTWLQPTTTCRKLCLCRFSKCADSKCFGSNGNFLLIFFELLASMFTALGTNNVRHCEFYVVLKSEHLFVKFSIKFYQRFQKILKSMPMVQLCCIKLDLFWICWMSWVQNHRYVQCIHSTWNRRIM